MLLGIGMEFQLHADLLIVGPLMGMANLVRPVLSWMVYGGAIQRQGGLQLGLHYKLQHLREPLSKMFLAVSYCREEWCFTKMVESIACLEAIKWEFGNCCSPEPFSRDEI